jgi:glycerol kinase
MLFNIHKLDWDNELLEALNIPERILPEPRTSSEVYGYTDPKVFGAKVPISGSIGDQQAALFGHGAYEPGIAKCTYGTGNFLLMNTGRIPCFSESLLTTIAWNIGGEVTYSLEGSVFITGAAIQWLKDSLKIINSPSEVEALATSLESNDGVYFVPALVGLGAPYWDQYARGIIVGLTRNTNRAHLARAALEAIAYFTKDVMEVMEKDSGKKIKELRVDGGATKNSFLMQFQADLLRKRILKPLIMEITSLGAAFMAGLAVDYWANLDELKSLRKIERIYKPCMDEEEAERLYHLWKDAVQRSKGWDSQTS